ncbi:DNA polymerase III subunit gamma/tau [Neisseria shayeganii 871]|uniref:DNA polymerase III subunit gamma/tau n=1 Tax=Neisseria shayeganii 871 TaxID=1032488 RepID=G4CHL2_9NEIS|nr:DNA polymerase III subunit gamma/tau [Neisseria shayeganii 871]
MLIGFASDAIVFVLANITFNFEQVKTVLKNDVYRTFLVKNSKKFGFGR